MKAFLGLRVHSCIPQIRTRRANLSTLFRLGGTFIYSVGYLTHRCWDPDQSEDSQCLHYRDLKGMTWPFKRFLALSSLPGVDILPNYMKLCPYDITKLSPFKQEGRTFFKKTDLNKRASKDLFIKKTNELSKAHSVELCCRSLSKLHSQKPFPSTQK